MMLQKYLKVSGSLIAIAVAALLMTTACSPSAREAVQSTSEIPAGVPTPTNVWSAVLQRTPYPYTTPLPPAEPTPLDSTYVKFDPRPGKRAPCRRCPPYPPEGGLWKLSLNRGIFRVYHEGTGWISLGSFTVSGNQVVFFNDPHCNQDVGIYTWELEDGRLVLEVVEDGCAFGLREENLTDIPWESCQPTSTEAAISDHWPMPVGCDATDRIP